MSSSTLERAASTAARSAGARGTRAGTPVSGRPATAVGAATTTRAGATRRGATTARATAGATARATAGATPGAATTRAGARASSARARGRTGRTTAGASESSGGTAPFVLLIMVLLTSGLVATLWLSTAAAADSYRLDAARQATRDRSEEVERLHRDVAAMQSAPALAAAAQRIGMVPAGAPAVILVHPDGTSQVVGTPSKARAAAPPPVPAGPASPPGPVNPAAPANPAAATAPDPEALANDPRSGVQASTGGAPAPAPAGAGTTTAAGDPAPAGAGATTSIPAAPVDPAHPALAGGR